ncbi:hypothetical protein [Mucilaginibacter antarcticus]|uniref:Secreted protein n=1 Tax=Mucilaginibacter antarcticus TaxID=1855725 RepID=A0ABW5XQY7_9SPHI
MNITKRIPLLVGFLLLLLAVVPVMAQGVAAPAESEKAKKAFNELLAETGMTFVFPEGFKEVKVPSTDALPFCYGMGLPGQEFEIWLRLSTQKEGEKLLADKNIHVSSPDSLYAHLAQDQIPAFTSEKGFLRRRLPDYILRRYNADAGSTYLLNIDDSRLTKHYKYALLTVLQKNQAGVVMAVCFTNEKGPEFFKTMGMAASCMKFKD